MKTASIPSLRVEPDLRRAVESVLHEGESLSSFVEQSLRAQIAQRRARQTFVARGLASRDEARHSGEYFSAEEVLREMSDMLAAAEAVKDGD